MKKILTALTAVVLLVATMLTATSCGSWDMSEIKATIKQLEEKDEIGSAKFVEGEDETGTKEIKKRYVVSSNEDDASNRDYLYIIEYYNVKLAKHAIKEHKLQQEYQKKYEKLDKKHDKLLEKIDVEVEEDEDDDDTVLKRKGAIVVYGDKDLYEKVFK